MTELPRLTWHAKPFGPGDIDGTGTQRLLGQPDLDLVDLLVRETAQNSWDARCDGVVPTFQIRLRTLTQEQVDVLRSNVFTGVGPTGGLRALLSEGRFQAMEILDRGTKGLGGTFRIDLDSEGSRDWIDFVLAVGAPPPGDSTGGGTYGFGKTASYLVSECSTILIWSATHHNSRVEQRFIASAMNEGFSQGNRRYTGRQWWGRVPEDSIEQIEPVVGEEARLLGETLFERKFEPGETGTSLLILAPTSPYLGDIDDEGEMEQTWAKRLPGAIIRNLWPKLVLGQSDEYCMSIRLFDHGHEIQLKPDPASATLAAMERCLQSVRASENPGSDIFLKCFEIRSQRPKKLIGHLALTRFTSKSDDTLTDLAGTVTWMRAPELVVRAKPYPGNRKDTMSWVGVFKPLDENDRAFAAAEPPAHDDWAHQSVVDKTQRSTVNVALTRIKAVTTEYLNPNIPSADQAATALPTAAISARLGALAGPTIGVRPIPGRPASNRSASKPESAGRRGGRGRVEVITTCPLPRTPQDLAIRRERSQITFEIDNLSEDTMELSASRLRIAIDGGHLADDADDVRIERWVGPHDEFLGSGETLSVSSAMRGTLEISYPMGIAVEVDLALVTP